MGFKTSIKIFAYFAVACCILAALLGYLLSYEHDNKNDDERLKKTIDSLNIIISLKDIEAKETRIKFDSVIIESQKQSREIDSLISSKESKRIENEKKYRNIHNMSDDKLNDILSDKLK